MYRVLLFSTVAFATSSSLLAAPVIDPIGSASIPAGKSLIIPVTASSPNGRPLTFTVTSSTNRIGVEVQTNNPFWKMTVVQAAPSNAPGSFLTPFRGGLVNVTNVGDLTFMLLRDRAPRAVDVIQGLTAAGFYSGNTIFHRVIVDFMIQGGDPLTNGMGGPVFRYSNEFHPRAIFSGRGQLALANSGKDTDGSQFFVTVAPYRYGDFSYTIFGQLLRGFDVLTGINNTLTDTNDRPVADVIISRASVVPNTTDTVITLTGTNLAGVSGTIRIIADDGAGARATNTFTATTVPDTNYNANPFLLTPAITNLIIPVNGRVTNYIAAKDLEGEAMVFDAFFALSDDMIASNHCTIPDYNGYTGMFSVAPNAGYTGPLRFYVAVAPNFFFWTYDYEEYTFAVGDTPVSAWGTNVAARPQEALAGRALATFTNGVPNSSVTNFAASINWGDNSVGSGVLSTNAAGQKEVRGSHTYTNAGTYPVYVTITSRLGAEATVVSTACVRPDLSLTRPGGQNLIRWPAWATDYQLESHTNLNGANWTAVTNLPSLQGYESVVTNATSAPGVFFRLRR